MVEAKVENRGPVVNRSDLHLYPTPKPSHPHDGVKVKPNSPCPEGIDLAPRPDSFALLYPEKEALAPIAIESLSPDVPPPAERETEAGSFFIRQADHGLGDHQTIVNINAALVDFSAKPKDHTSYKLPPPIVKNRAKRGKVRGLSHPSRRRCLRKLSCINFDGLPEGVQVLMASMTYHENVPDPDSVIAHSHRRAFEKRLQRKDPDSMVFWIMEEQGKREPVQAVHWHYLIFTAHEDLKVKARTRSSWFSDNWHEITGETSHWHRDRFGCVVEPLRSTGKTRSYFTKYATKGDQHEIASPYVGRRWGHSQALSAYCAPVEVSEGVEDYKLARRFLRRLKRASRPARAATRRKTGFVLLNESEVDALRRYLEHVRAGRGSSRASPSPAPF